MPKPISFIHNLYIAQTTDNKGRGVFAAQPIQAGETIEICPVIICPTNQRQHLDPTILYDYYFLWGNNDLESAIALGYGSIYNHSYQPNAEYLMNFKNKTIQFTAILPIPAHHEITINYNADHETEKPLWFHQKK